MYKLIIILMLYLIQQDVLANLDDLTPEQREMLGNLHKSCVEETGVSEDLISNAAKGNFAEDKTLKCYMKCLMTSIGVMEDDGNFDFEAYVDLLPESMRAAGEKIAANCKGSIKPGDACESAYSLNKCSYETDPSKYMLF